MDNSSSGFKCIDDISLFVALDKIIETKNCPEEPAISELDLKIKELITKSNQLSYVEERGSKALHMSSFMLGGTITVLGGAMAVLAGLATIGTGGLFAVAGCVGLVSAGAFELFARRKEPQLKNDILEVDKKIIEIIKKNEVLIQSKLLKKHAELGIDNEDVSGHITSKEFEKIRNKYQERLENREDIEKIFKVFQWELPSSNS